MKIKCNYQTRITKENVPIAKIDCDKDVVVETVNAYGKRFSNLNDLLSLIENSDPQIHHHPMTGPIHVNGAKKGDVLKVQIKKISVLEMGQALSKSAGIEPLKNPSFGDRAPVIGELIENKKYIKYSSGLKVLYNPMVGIISTTPENDHIKAGHAGKTGGNLDIPFVTEGVAVYLPVEVDGANLYLGDVHAAQGYGELGGVAMEASAEVTIRVSLLRPVKDYYKSFNTSPIVIMGKEPLTKKNAMAVIGIGEASKDLHSAILDSYINAVSIFKLIKPTISENILKALITLIGHSINGQAFSYTAESTSMILFLESDLKSVFKFSTTKALQEIENCLYLDKI